MMTVRNSAFAFRLSVCVLIPTVLSAGCDYAFRTLKFPGIKNAASLEDDAAEEQRQRERYRTKKDDAAFRWLMANRVQQGMSVGEVNRILGEDGRRIYDDARLKSRNTSAQLTDETYEWGGEGTMQKYILFFRNDRLVNFEPKLYRETEPSFD